MNCGYVTGWCEECFQIPLTTVEVCCKVIYVFIIVLIINFLG